MVGYHLPRRWEPTRHLRVEVVHLGVQSKVLHLGVAHAAAQPGVVEELERAAATGWVLTDQSMRNAACVYVIVVAAVTCKVELELFV